MCGINGIFAYDGAAPPVDRRELLATRDAMLRRGPDGAGVWILDDQRLGFASRRLAVIDLSDDALQPMSSADGRFIVTFNGEIYNYRELRDGLEHRGHVFRTKSDTEVLLHLYRERGVAMLKKLRGMFAFAIWDNVEKSLFLARDPFGIKPLYISDDGKTLRFASQVKALLAGGSVSQDMSEAGEAGYWIWGHIPGPHTLYRGISEFEPGTWRIIRRGGIQDFGKSETVADILGLALPHVGMQSDSKAEPDLRDVLIDTVRHHLVADVPVCLFLSSGIDSSTLLSLATECGADVKTITLGFSEFKGTEQDETRLAEMVAKRYGAKHETIWIERKDFEASVDAYLNDMDQPSIDGLNTWLVCRAGAQRGFKVALSGLGGDELFAGYPSFRDVPAIRRVARPFAMIPGLGRALRQLSLPMVSAFTSQKFAGFFEYGGTWDGAYMLRRAMRMPWEVSHEAVAGFSSLSGVELSGRSDFLRVSYFEMTRYMRYQLLRDADWASMAHSIELRVPFIDKVLARHVANHAHSHKPYSKADLARVAHPVLPLNVTSRNKTGFMVPVRAWMEVRFSVARGRGLRPWQNFVRQRYSSAKPSERPLIQDRKSFALWAPETATYGGVQSYMWRLWEMLQTAYERKASLEVKGITLKDSTEAIGKWPNAMIRRPSGAFGSKLRFVMLALSQKARADLVIVGHLNQSPVAWIAKRLGLIRDYVVVLHGIEAWRRAGLLERLALGDAHNIVATTRFTATICAEVNDLPPDKFAVLPLCAEPQPEAPDPNFRLDGEWPILFVARLSKSERYKGLETLIETIGALKHEGLPLKLHIIGEGDDRRYFENYARTHLSQSDGVTFHGRVDGARLQAAYKSAKAFVMPSAKEGFGIVFLEAMRYGVPCIGATNGGTPEVFEDGLEGLLVPFRQVEPLKEQIRKLFYDPHYARQIGVAARGRFERDYTFEAFAERWLKFLQVGTSRNNQAV